MSCETPKLMGQPKMHWQAYGDKLLQLRLLRWALYLLESLQMPTIVTFGDGLTGIAKYVKPGNYSYTAQDLPDYLTGHKNHNQC